MLQPELLDVVELLVDLPDVQLQAGDQGTIRRRIMIDRCHEVESLTHTEKPLALLVLKPRAVSVCWFGRTQPRPWVPLTDRITAVFAETAQKIDSSKS